MCCLSKGLCAPVGSLLAGPADVIAEARGERQRLGGGMRQAGIIAAAGLVALEHDGRAAGRGPRPGPPAGRGGGRAVARRPACDPPPVRTNVVTWRHPDAAGRSSTAWPAEGVLAGTIAPGVVRLVTHHDVDDDGVERAVKALRGAA